MDLDFTSIGIRYRALRKRILDLLDSKTYYDITFSVEEYNRPVDDPNGFGAIIMYSHSWRKSNFKMEVSFRELPILPARKQILKDELYWKYCDFLPFEVPCMEMEELIAEKIRAAHERTRSRDLYDLFVYSRNAFDEPKVRSLAVLKCWNSGTVFNPDSLLAKFRDNENYDWDDLRRLVRPERMPRESEIINEVCKRYSFLKKLDNSLSTVRDDAKRHKQQNLVNQLIKVLNKK
jgi:hypothetical protein